LFTKVGLLKDILLLKMLPHYLYIYRETLIIGYPNKQALYLTFSN